MASKIWPWLVVGGVTLFAYEEGWFDSLLGSGAAVTSSGDSPSGSNSPYGSGPPDGASLWSPGGGAPDPFPGGGPSYYGGPGFAVSGDALRDDRAVAQIVGQPGVSSHWRNTPRPKKLNEQQWAAMSPAAQIAYTNQVTAYQMAHGPLHWSRVQMPWLPPVPPRVRRRRKPHHHSKHPGHWHTRAPHPPAHHGPHNWHQGRPQHRAPGRRLPPWKRAHAVGPAPAHDH